MVVLQKLEIFLVFHSIFDMEGQRQKIKDFLIGLFIIIGHSIEQSFLIAYYIVIYKMVVHSKIFYLLRFDVLAVFECLAARYQSLVTVLLGVEIVHYVGVVFFKVFVGQEG